MKKLICAIVIVCHTVVIAGCAAGAKAHKEAIDARLSGDFETSIEKLEEAVSQDPSNITYQMDLYTLRDRAVHVLMGEGDAALAVGDYDAAEISYNRVLEVETRNGRALRGLDAVADARVHAIMVVRAQSFYDQGEAEEALARLRAVLAEDPAMHPARALMEKINAAQKPVIVTPKLHTNNDAPVTMQFRDADTKMIFEVLSRQTGINFIFDQDVRKDGRTTIFVRDVSIEQAIDLVLGQNQLGRQVLSDNMVLIYPNTPAKQLEYQDQVIKTFYLTNADPQRFSEMLKTMLNVKTVFVEERSDAVIVRDTPEVIRMAESLLASIDLAESEVMLEIQILEISRTQMEQIGIQYPTAVTLQPTALAGPPLVLADLGSQDSTTITITPVPITIDLAKEVGASHLLASPRIRARNHEKAEILIGQRVPIISNAVTPTANGQSVVTGSVEYVDVGLTLKVEPTIHLNGEVTIILDLEVSNIIREIFNSTSGTLAYQIGTRNTTTVLRLRNGETQILSGLIQSIDRQTSNRIPGLGDIPILGRLFGSNKTSDEKSEIVMSITPHIVRAQSRPANEHTEFWYGTESNLRSAPLASTGSRSNRGSSTPSTALSLMGATGGTPGSPADANANSDATADAAPPQRLTLDWDAPGQVSVGDTFDVALTINSPTGLASLRTQLRFDQAALELTSVDVGDFIPSAVHAASQPAVLQRAGRVKMDVASTGEALASGSGSVMVMHFKALLPRPGTSITVQQFSAKGVDNLAVPAMAPRPLVVVVGQ